VIRAGGRALLAALVLMFVAGGLALPAKAALPGADEAARISVLLDELTPSSGASTGTLRVRGRVVNQSGSSISNVAVALRRSSAPLTSRSQLDGIAQAPLSDEAADVPLPSTRVVAADILAPNARRAFELQIPLAEAGFTTAGTYALTVEASGQVDGAASSRQGAARTFLPWVPDDASVTPLDVVWLWPLADWPARDVQGQLLNNRTPEELSPGGRLDLLARLGGRFPDVVSWVADPALLQTARAMSGGYEVAGPGGTAEIGSGDAAAGAWLDLVDQSARGSTIRLLPYADVDASALTRAGMVTDVVRSVTQAPAVARAALNHPAEGSFAWAPFGRLDRPTLDVLSSAGVTTLVMSAAATPATDTAASVDGLATTALATSTGSMRAVLTDPVLSGLAASSVNSPAEAIQARQRFLGETLVLAQSLPADQTMRSVVIGPSSVRWSPTTSLLSPLLRATRTAAWLHPESLEQLLAAPVPSVSRARGGYGPRARAAELAPEYMERVKRTSRELDSFTSIIDDPTGISEPYSEALLRAESSGWRTEPDTGSRLVSSIARTLADQTSQVRVLSAGTITFSGDTGRVPITIENGLDRSVTVGVALRGQPQLRLSSQPLQGIRIDPGRMASVDIDARVVGGDPLEVSVQLLGPEEQDYGRPATVTVMSTAYSRAAAWVVAIAFLAIAVFVVVGIFRRIRAARR
jgi:hypothetical protein